MVKRKIIIGVIGIFLASFFVQNIAAAQEATEKQPDINFWANNDVKYYDSRQPTCSPTASSGSTVTALRGADNREKIFNYLTDAGLSNEQAAGVVGNIQHESGFSPGRQEMSQAFPAGGWGIVQWTFERRSAGVVPFLQNLYPTEMATYYSPAYGGATTEANGFVPDGMPVEVNDKLLLGQLDFLYKESSESRTIRSLTASLGYGSVGDNEWETLKKQTTVKGASDIWVYNFEIPANIHATAVSRAESGNTILARYAAGAGAAAIDASKCGPAELSLSGPTAQKVVQVAEAEYKKWEAGEMKAGGDYKKYSFGYETEWCALFVSWVYKEAGRPVDINGRDHALLVSELMNMGKNKVGGQFEWHENDGSYTPRAGDIAIYASNGGSGDTYHTNIVISASSPTHVVTIGGNEGAGGTASGITSTIVKKAEGSYWPGEAKGYVSPTELKGAM